MTLLLTDGNQYLIYYPETENLLVFENPTKLADIYEALEHGTMKLRKIQSYVSHDWWLIVENRNEGEKGIVGWVE